MSLTDQSYILPSLALSKSGSQGPKTNSLYLSRVRPAPLHIFI